MNNTEETHHRRGDASADNDLLYFRSCAEWRPGHVYGCERPNVTEDRHDTREQAEAVCAGLRREGLGRERCHFPLKTWVEEIREEI